MSRSMYDKLYRRYGKTLPESEISAQAAALIEDDQKLWPAASLAPDCRNKLDTTRVAIVGGGFAGMMAAWSLCQAYKGIEVVVFEARAEVGGRVWSNEDFTKGPRTIEFGAELVGANHPAWIEIARTLGVGLMTRTGEHHYKAMQLAMKVRIDGKDLSEKAAEQMTKEMEAIFLEISKDASEINDPTQPWNDPRLQKFDNMSVDDKLLRSRPDGLALNKTKLGYRGIQMQLENNMVIPLQKINYLALLCLVKAGRFGSDKDGKDKEYLGFWQQTEAFRCTDGCQTLLKKMIAKLTDPKEKYKFTLLTNTQVNKIETDSMGQQKPVQLRWTSTAAVRRVDAGFDYVILAAPPSVWGDIAITPQLPKEVGAIQMGPAVKFFTNLKNRFWIEEHAAPSGISSDLGMIWEGTDNQMQVGKSEIELSVFAGGRATVGRDEAYYKAKLGKLYPGYNAVITGKKPQLANWPIIKHIQTGYSCPRPGHMFTVAPVLQTPFNDRLYLAGEHTQTDFFGFMEGALGSGRRAARAVMSKICPGSFTDLVA
jgi:monoamine oxidase